MTALIAAERPITASTGLLTDDGLAESAFLTSNPGINRGYGPNLPHQGAENGVLRCFPFRSTSAVWMPTLFLTNLMSRLN